MIFNDRKSYVLNFALILALLGGFLGTKPAQASAPLAIEATSQESFLNPDGTLKLDGDFKGTLDLEGWDVNMDSHPIWRHNPPYSTQRHCCSPP